ncbi:hypothetical protein [Streptomyces sioyaensis]|uniref:hypothetical protein n=1 Tax=Streptomyces sioyaensis TaxID=67364 RepID=UPI00379E4D34
MVICELLRVPHEERERFRVWSDAVVSLTAHTADQVVARQREMAAAIGSVGRLGHRRTAYEPSAFPGARPPCTLAC